jgi:hypothetical protein
LRRPKKHWLIHQSPANIERILARLAELGLKTDKPSNVTGKGKRPDEVQVRYFAYPRDTARAQAILKVLQNDSGIMNSRISYVIDKELAKDTWIELWFDSRKL